jgi:hypothetical protein
VEHGRARGEPLGAGLGVEDLYVLVGEADADFHALVPPPVVLLAEHPHWGAINPAFGGTFQSSKNLMEC